MHPSGRARAALRFVSVLAVGGALLSACGTSPTGPTAMVQRYLAAWSKGDYASHGRAGLASPGGLRGLQPPGGLGPAAHEGDARPPLGLHERVEWHGRRHESPDPRTARGPAGAKPADAQRRVGIVEGGVVAAFDHPLARAGGLGLDEPVVAGPGPRLGHGRRVLDAFGPDGFRRHRGLPGDRRIGPHGRPDPDRGPLTTVVCRQPAAAPATPPANNATNTATAPHTTPTPTSPPKTPRRRSTPTSRRRCPRTINHPPTHQPEQSGQNIHESLREPKAPPTERSREANSAASTRPRPPHTLLTHTRANRQQDHDISSQPPERSSECLATVKSYTQKLWMRVKRKAAYLPG